jgi:hypothetical protein
MDSHSTSRPLALVLAAVAVPLAAWAALPGCAEPCLDDGLFQKACPANETEAATGDESPTGDGDADTFGDTDSCALIDIILIPQKPTLVLLVDQSGSMTADFGGNSRWDVVIDVLADPQAGIVAQYENNIRFGLALYTSYNGFEGGECPVLTEVDPALGNYAAIAATLNESQPLVDTPTGESLDIVAQKLGALEFPGRKYVVIATDGEPDTCAVPNPQNGQAESVAAAAAAYAMGIESFIISVGDDVSDAHLQDMANAGQGVPPGGPNADFYKANDQAALESAFDAILANVRSCQLDLMTSITAEEAMACTVKVNGDPVGFGDPNGWQLNGADEMELLGSSCDALQQATSAVKMECACDAG